MSGISSGVGLVSGINYQSLITQLVAIDKVPQNIVQDQINETQAFQTVYNTFSTDLSGLQTIARQLSLPDTFQAATTSSSNPSVLTATAGQGAAVGAYQFQVAQLVTTQQSITNGFANANNAPIGAGTITIEEGNGQASSQTPLSQLNGGSGVQRGQFRITDGSGNSAIIDISDAVNLDDVINDINSATGIDVKAKVTDTGITLTDTSGGSGSLKVQDLGGGSAASSLGIAGSGSGSIVGTSINYIGNDTQLDSLNDGLGVGAASSTEINNFTPLSTLDGDHGIGAATSGSDFKITVANGVSFNVAIGTASTLGQVLTAINTDGKGDVLASIAPGSQSIEIQDSTTGSATFQVTATAGSSAAARLGILGTGSDGIISGTPITNPDFQVNLSDGTNFDVTVGAAHTVGDLLKAINTAGDGKVTASVASNGQSIQIVDNSGGSGPFSIAALNGSQAAADLGIAGTATGSTITGSAVQAGLDSVLLSSLKGGSGLPAGTISITNRSGITGTVNFTGATSFSDVLSDINGADLGVSASLNSAGTGIQLTDTSGGSGNLVVSDVTSTTAAALGIAGTFTNATPTVVGSNLQRQYISDNTLLSTLGGGQGVQLGEFTITNSDGQGSTINLTNGVFNTVGDVINAINQDAAGVTASINANGNGILLTDTAGGKGTLTVKDDGGTTASDLNIAGTATGTTLDGGFEKTIAVTASDTLSSVQAKINKLGFGVTAQLVNDGSPSNPYRLSLTSLNSGAAGQVIIDGGTTNLNPTTLVQGQDAAVFYGGSGDSQPLLITSNTNQISNVISGVTVNLTGASSSPVTLNVTLDPSSITTDLGNFVTQFNSLVNQIATFSAYNTTTNQGSLLLGDSTTEQIQQVLYSAISSIVSNVGQFDSLSQIGITVNQNAQLTFDTNTFTAAFASDPTGVQNLFSKTLPTVNSIQDQPGLGYVLTNAINELTDPISGIITLQDNTLTSRIQNYQSYYNTLNTLVEQQQASLEQQFANLETNIASLQSQQQVLSAFSGATASTAASSSSSSGSSSSG